MSCISVRAREKGLGDTCWLSHVGPQASLASAGIQDGKTCLAAGGV